MQGLTSLDPRALTIDARAVLGIDSGADADEVKRAYRAACLRWHPDKNPNDPEAERHFQEVQLAFNMLTVDADATEALAATETFISKLGTDVLQGPTPAVSKSATKIRIGDGVLFVGDVEGGQPHGVGELILKDGAVHHGTFVQGRAEGLGLFYAANGTVFRGCFTQNRRTGPFEVIDPKGGKWHDLYDESGKRVRRTQAVVKVMEAMEAAVEEAKADAAAAAAQAMQAKAAVAAAEAAVTLAQAQPPPQPPPKPPPYAMPPPPPISSDPAYEPLTAEQRRAAAERRRLAGAAIRAEQRLAEGGGFAGVGSPTGEACASQRSPNLSFADGAAAEAAACEETSAEEAAAAARATASRAATTLFTDAVSTPSAAVACRECGAKFHVAFTSRCRRHHMEWMEVPQPVDWKEFPEGGLWRCCSKTTTTAEGCALGWHIGRCIGPQLE